MSAFLFSAASDKPFIRSCTIRVHSFHKKLIFLAEEQKIISCKRNLGLAA